MYIMNIEIAVCNNAFQIDLTLQIFYVVLEMILDKRSYKVVTVIVAIVESENKRDAIVLCGMQQILW
ncbi:hypothetical protein X777_02209 [Ooceraea biroi]|uniref:Uncharacterized protein n=1 Tax=Ooceraea biroi TaxID=2015173 RepID=A0A026WN88_OOCBI|nr:hypothetical protein X777_02209 [Ooceraea biroi]